MLFFLSKNSYQSSYYLVIDSIDVGSKKEVIFYSKGKKINLSPYYLSTIDGIKVGDSISKNSCAEYVYFYRKDTLGNYYEFNKYKPIGLFPLNWFCN